MQRNSIKSYKRKTTHPQRQTHQKNIRSCGTKEVFMNPERPVWSQFGAITPGSLFELAWA